MLLLFILYKSFIDFRVLIQLCFICTIFIVFLAFALNNSIQFNNSTQFMQWAFESEKNKEAYLRQLQNNNKHNYFHFNKEKAIGHIFNLYLTAFW